LRHPDRTARRRGRILALWTLLALAMGVPILLAATSPLLAYRNAAYIIGGFAGIICLSLLLIQPLLAGGYLPGFRLTQERRWHRRIGAGIIACVVLHVAGLYVTSPPDALDALLLVAPTPFSVYGVTAMWGVVLTALLVALRHRLRLSPSAWRLIHNALALAVVVSTVVHAVQIEGAMEAVSKWGLCVAVLIATGMVLLDLRLLRPILRRRSGLDGPASQ
jgi:Ferric reductase like transmembrane component